MLFPGMYERRRRRYLKRLERRTRRKNRRKLYKMLHFERLSNIAARNHLLTNASCYYEFPLIQYDNPPSNSYIDHCLAHAFQKAGFETKTHSGVRQLEHSTDSESEIPFEGIMRGREFGNKKNLRMIIIFMILSTAFFLGDIATGIFSLLFMDFEISIIIFAISSVFLIAFVVFLIIYLKWRKKMPYTATVVFWGVNKYKLNSLDSIVGSQNQISGDMHLNEMKKLIEYASKFHPILTILHVTIAFEMKPKRFGSKEAVLHRFSILKEKILHELGTFPIQYDHQEGSHEINAKAIFRWKKRKLHGIEERFPLV